MCTLVEVSFYFRVILHVVCANTLFHKEVIAVGRTTESSGPLYSTLISFVFNLVFVSSLSTFLIKVPQFTSTCSPSLSLEKSLISLTFFLLEFLFKAFFSGLYRTSIVRTCVKISLGSGFFRVFKV